MSSSIDLRSDTVTKPTPEMRQAMFEAEVGDDVYGDDPTVERLEQLSATLLGKEKALFVPTGTFGNQLCLFTHTTSGQEVLMAESNHILWHEAGAASVIAGVQIRSLNAPKGELDIKELRQKIRGDDIHEPETGLICMENAHSSGSVVSLENMKAVFEVAQAFKLPIHLDGARIFNASVALNISPAAIAAYADSIQFCLSKGLCAPIGSMVVGTKSFIEKARRKRKLMGGGMRQVGIIAAAGIIALEQMIDRLAEDHKNAKILAEQLATLPGIQILSDQLDINMVFFTLDFQEFTLNSSAELVEYFKENGILINGEMDGWFRLVTHRWIQSDELEKVFNAFCKISKKIASNS